jgi:hypothetical protein
LSGMPRQGVQTWRVRGNISALFSQG